MKRRFIIDTDTGSDDAWAIVEAMLAVDLVQVDAITVVCGNLPLDLCQKNAILAAEAAGTYVPAVYRGADRPLCTQGDFYAPEVHGADGLSGMNLPDPDRKPEKEPAEDALIRLAAERPGEYELVCIGPLTNIAHAVQKDPNFAKNIKKAWILGGAYEKGNMTPAAEYNVFVDPEAANIVLKSGMRSLWLTWDASRFGGEITWPEADRLRDEGSPAGVFCERCSRQLRVYYKERSGDETFGVVDSVIMTAALYPDVMAEVVEAYCTVTEEAGTQRGYFAMDIQSETPNAEVCILVDARKYKQRLFSLLGVEV